MPELHVAGSAAKESSAWLLSTSPRDRIRGKARAPLAAPLALGHGRYQQRGAAQIGLDRDDRNVAEALAQSARARCQSDRRAERSAVRASARIVEPLWTRARAGVKDESGVADAKRQLLRKFPDRRKLISPAAGPALSLARQVRRSRAG
jgi:hypothetical protein